MDKAREISASLWELYKKFCDKRKSDSSWDVYLSQCQSVANKYQEPEKSFAEYMALAFINYIEEKEKQKVKRIERQEVSL